ncbi:hypothetical protein U1Q18_047349 [Sarracenia purpurea var. burkii]
MGQMTRALESTRKGELSHNLNQTNQEEEVRVSRVRNWKRKVRESNESPILTTGKGDVGKRKAEGQIWNEVSDDQE